MTERFEANDYYHFILDNETNHEISVTEATELLNRLYRENQGLNEFSNKVFELINKTIKRETQIAENIESTIEGDYVKAVNRLTIATLENLKKELS